MEKFNEITIERKGFYLKEDLEESNKLGLHGWKLIDVRFNYKPNSTMYYYKKRKWWAFF